MVSDPSSERDLLIITVKEDVCMPLDSYNPFPYPGISLSAYLECVLHLLLHLALASGRTSGISREHLLLRLPGALPC